MLSEKDKNILRIFASSVRRRFSDAQVWGFGSRVRGAASQESDLDVCVVVNKLDDAIDKVIMDIAWEIGFEHDIIISTVTYAKEEFEKGPCSESSLVKTVLHEGVAA